MDPVTAAWLGEAIEIICPPLLVFGLATRFAALPMLILSLVIQFSYQALDQHLFWAILFGWFVVKGAGPISLDALIGRGIAATALPLAAMITRFFGALSGWGDPAIKLFLRCWIAVLFFRSGVMKLSNFDMTEMLFHAQSAQRLLPPELAARLTILLELGCLIFLVLGAGTRITAIILIGLITIVDPSYQQSIDLAYYLMVLGLIALQGPGALSIGATVGGRVAAALSTLRSETPSPAAPTPAIATPTAPRAPAARLGHRTHFGRGLTDGCDVRRRRYGRRRANERKSSCNNSSNHD